MQLCVLACLWFTAIVYPLKFKTYCTCKAVLVMSIGGSVVSLIISIAVAVLTMAVEYEEYYAVSTVIFTVNFIVPSSIFTVLHCLKLRALRRSPALNSNSSLKMNVVVSVVLSIYVISSASMMMNFILVWQYEIVFLSLVTSLSFLINCAINPFIYFFSSPPIVQLFRKIWHRFCCKCQVANNGNAQEIELHNASTTWGWIRQVSGHVSIPTWIMYLAYPGVTGFRRWKRKFGSGGGNYLWCITCHAPIKTSIICVFIFNHVGHQRCLLLSQKQ